MILLSFLPLLPSLNSCLSQTGVELFHEVQDKETCSRAKQSVTAGSVCVVWATLYSHPLDNRGYLLWYKKWPFKKIAANPVACCHKSSWYMWHCAEYQEERTMFLEMGKVLYSSEMLCNIFVQDSFEACWCAVTITVCGFGQKGFKRVCYLHESVNSCVFEKSL